MDYALQPLGRVSQTSDDHLGLSSHSFAILCHMLCGPTADSEPEKSSVIIDKVRSILLLAIIPVLAHSYIDPFSCPNFFSFSFDSASLLYCLWSSIMID